MNMSTFPKYLHISYCCAAVLLAIFFLMMTQLHTTSIQPPELTYNDLRYEHRQWHSRADRPSSIHRNDWNHVHFHIHYSPSMNRASLASVDRLTIHHHTSLQVSELQRIKEMFPQSRLIAYTDHRFWFVVDNPKHNSNTDYYYFLEDYVPTEAEMSTLIKATQTANSNEQERIFGLHGERQKLQIRSPQKNTEVDALHHGWLLPDHLLDLYMFTARKQMKLFDSPSHRTEGDVSLSTGMFTRILQHLGIKSTVIPSHSVITSTMLSASAAALILPAMEVDVAVIVRSSVDIRLCQMLNKWHCHATEGHNFTTPTALIQSESSVGHFLAFASPRVVIYDIDHPIHLPSTIVGIPVELAQLQSYMFLNNIPARLMQDFHKPKFTLTIITANRLASLQRLLESIKRAYYLGDSVILSIAVDASAPGDLLDFLHKFKWEFGPYVIRHRIASHGLLPAITESWYPVTLDDYSIILEDDIEVSPHFYTYSKHQTLLMRYPTPQPNVFGISLYTPRVSEITYPKRRFSPSNYTDTPFLLQLPCSWGAVYFPEYWWTFHQYVQNPSSLRLPQLKSNGWQQSWKKYFMQLVYVYGWLMLYPNHPSGASFSTNHMEMGEHFGKTYQGRKHDYTVPLIQAWDQHIVQSFGGFVFDVYHEPSSIELITQRGINDRGNQWKFESRWM